MLAFAALLITVSTIFIPRKVVITESNYDGYTYEERRHVNLGYPVYFITQDLSRLSPPYPFPKVHGFGNPLEDPKDILWLRFFISYIMIFGTCEGLYYGFKKLSLKTKKS